MWPGKRATMGLTTRLDCPVGSMSRRRFRPALSSQRVTVRTDTTVPRGELVTDTTGGPLVGAAPVLDEVHRLGTGPGGTVGWGAGAVLESLGSSLVVTSEPLRQRGAGDAGLGGYVGDRTTGLDTHHEPVAVLRRQHSVTVSHGSGAFSCRKDDSAPPILTAQAPLPPRLQPHDPQQLSTIHRPHGARAPLSQRHTISDQPAQMPLPIDFADPLRALPERDGA